MTDLFLNRGIAHQGVLSLSPKEALELTGKGVFLIDLRDPDYVDYKAFDAEMVICLPMDAFDDRVMELDRAGYYILSDASGIKSREYANKMLALGFVHVATLSGGFVEWERDGLPVRVDINERLTGACACQLKPRERKKRE
jgi:rhodanese-related sulfurtransferase